MPHELGYTNTVSVNATWVRAHKQWFDELSVEWCLLCIEHKEDTVQMCYPGTQSRCDCSAPIVHFGQFWEWEKCLLLGAQVPLAVRVQVLLVVEVQVLLVAGSESHRSNEMIGDIWCMFFLTVLETI